MAITALPTPPSRQDPTNFNDRADAFLGALPTFATEANTLQTDVNAKQVAAALSESNAAASATSAAATAGVVKWVSGTTYANGAAVFSAVNYLTYRRKTASGSGTTDPSLDTTNYALVVGTGDVSTSGNQTINGDKQFTGTTSFSGAISATSATFSGRVLVANGSAAAPSLGFSSDGSTDTGFYWLSDGTFGFTNNGVASGTIATGGNLTMVGNVTAYSDERLKENWSDLPVDFIEKLSKVKVGTYTRKDNGQRQAGTSAQDWSNLLPEVVSENSEGILSLAYGNAALVSCIELAKEVQKLKEEIAKLKGL